MTKLLTILTLAALNLYSADYIEPYGEINTNEGRRVVPTSSDELIKEAGDL